MRGLSHYRFIDYLTQGYIVLVGLVILFFHGERVDSWQFLIAAHAAALVCVHILIVRHARNPAHRTLGFLRNFYPVLFYTGFYRETGALNQMFIAGYLDPVFIRFEERLFGCQPALELAGLLPYRWAGELFYGAYFSYYVMIVGVGIALYLVNRNGFYHYLSVVSFVFYVCYAVYICLPVVGPRLFYQEGAAYRLPAEVVPADVPPVPQAVQQAFFYRVMCSIYDLFEASGAAFPSSHVAVAICTLFFSFRYLRPIRWAHAVCVVLLCISTVYGKYHYTIDVFAGAMSAAILIPVGNALVARFGEIPGQERVREDDKRA